MFAQQSFVLAWFLKISKHNVWVSQSILLQLLPMRTQNSNLPCASAFVRQSRTFHSINALRTFYRMHTFLNWRNVYLNTIRVWSGSKPCLQMYRARGARLRISKFVLIFAKKFDRTRCLAVSILEYNINWTERAKVFWLSAGRTK